MQVVTPSVFCSCLIHAQLSDKINDGAATVTAKADDYSQQASDIVMRQAKTVRLPAAQFASSNLCHNDRHT